VRLGALHLQLGDLRALTAFQRALHRGLDA